MTLWVDLPPLQRRLQKEAYLSRIESENKANAFNSKKGKEQ